MPEKETCLNEGEKAWQAVRTEAGHPTYLEYLYATDHEYLGSRCADQRKDVHPIKCSIIDLSINTRSVTMSAQEFCSEISPAETAKEILAALRQPPRSACLRIVLWWLTDREHSGLTPELLNVCGLGLKIDSRFFEAIIEKTDRGYLSTRMEMIQPFLSSPAFRAKCLVFGSAAAIVARDYIIGEPNVPPVLLIVGWNDKNWANEMSYIDEDWSAVHHARHSDDLMHREDYNCQVFSNNVIKSEFLRSQMYIKTLNIMLQQSDSTHIGDGNIIFLSVLPLIHLDSLHMYAKMRLLRSRNYFEFLHRTDDSSAELMKLERYILRQHIEDSETCRQNFPTFARSQGGIDALDNQEYRSSQEFWRNALDEARRIELAIRDDMQLQVSQLSLKESKTSIELSNRQIEESRRGECLMTQITKSY